ncbi:FHA domain-containing protein [Botrimarina hoheduenensis]|uniref:FHA domain-containing protein n=1 Tax=Botrimarina hoheduenensis TaxID=2528000 RepID=A0A5C5VWF3_9BACT|nr:FHA domain-containing protein [Botrimarina hoheduenensis]TWT42854.1 hypothetical protein Pla111_24920 [Botrimarina hoheduenensis]
MSIALTDLADPLTALEPIGYVLRDANQLGLAEGATIGATPLTIGAGPRCTLRLPGAGLRPLHCVVSLESGRLMARRWASNTWLNDEEFNEAELTSGDRLRIGSNVFEIARIDAPASDFAARIETPPSSSDVAEPSQINLSSAAEAIRTKSPEPKTVEESAFGKAPDSPAGPVEPAADEADSAWDLASGIPSATSPENNEDTEQDPAIPARLLQPWSPKPKAITPPAEEPQIDADPAADSSDSWGDPLADASSWLATDSPVADDTTDSETADNDTDLVAVTADAPERDPWAVVERVAPISSAIEAAEVLAENNSSDEIDVFSAKATEESETEEFNAAPSAEAANDAEPPSDEPVNRLADPATDLEARSSELLARRLETTRGRARTLLATLRRERITLLDHENQRAALATELERLELALTAADTRAEEEAAGRWAAETHANELAERVTELEAAILQLEQTTAVCEPPSEQAVSEAPAEAPWLTGLPAADERVDAQVDTAEEPVSPADPCVAQEEEPAQAAPDFDPDYTSDESSDSQELWAVEKLSGDEPGESVRSEQLSANHEAVEDRHELPTAEPAYDESMSTDDNEGESSESLRSSASTSLWADDEQPTPASEGLWSDVSPQEENAAVEQQIEPPLSDLREEFNQTDERAEAALKLAAEALSADPFAARVSEDESSEAVRQESFYEKYSHLLPADDSASPEVAAPVAAPARIAPPSEPTPVNASANSADDESVEDYMQRMMQRLRGSDDAPVAKPKPTFSTSQQAEEETVAPATPKEDIKPIANLEELRGGLAPEHATDMGALRQLANQSARQAIDVAKTNKNKENATVRLMIATVCLGGGAMACLAAPDALDLLSLTGYSAILAGAFFGYRTLSGIKSPKSSRS